MVVLYFILLLAFSSFSDAYKNWFTMEGEAFAVKCPFAEDHETVTWHLSKTNKTISTDEKMRIFSSGVYLWFLPTSTNDSGNYICVKHKSDSQTIESVNVTIHPYKEGICYYNEDLYSYTSGIPGSGKIYCPSINKYKTASDVKWYKDCKYINGSRYVIQNSRLYISGANEADNGNYTCQFTYTHGGRKFNVSATRTFEVVEDSSPIPIKVLYPQDNEVIEAEIGSPKNLSCKALLGHRKQDFATIFWNIAGDYDQDMELYMVPNEGYYAEAVLHIKEVRKTDLNINFECVIANDLESRAVNVTLHCIEPCEGHKNTYPITGFITLFVITTILMNCLFKEEEELYIKKLTVEDSGNYTCVVSYLNAGKLYNATNTIQVQVIEEDAEYTKPTIIGPDSEEVEIEIGKEKMINCTAFLGYSNNSPNVSFYWLHNKQWLDNCLAITDSVSPCEMDGYITYNEGAKFFALKQLWIKNFQEEDINSIYTCTLSTAKSTNAQTKTFTLKKVKSSDVSQYTFTTGMIMAILCPLGALVVIILCVVFRVELALTYRDLAAKDETLGDGKIYDAFVSYLKDCIPICGEERVFALDILPKILEEHFGYKLCLFERDISPGGAIVDDVQSFIDGSRRLIIILSKNYVSDKVMFELEAGLHKALVERKIKVILIEYMPISDFNFLPDSLELLSSSHRVKWKGEKSLPLNSRFWKRLRYAMPAKSSSMNALAYFRRLHSR
ncbi:interleukin-18 receptor 1 [Eublepharis macularius]|uniref:Interleukin-18 receptor 1 n=1 Tax=Eublepharis macularius TaxID=481883 RepID=A0AA97KUX9_EUBMA|nr:interleukin-18 receptor 1 [Eublepharis macularius]